ncbi:MAG: alkaline phosphatase family protein, partial [Bergeyella zoohelcum]|nr:alkaline phosphatase family protein [Bergeyella zoohelcum]
MDRRSFLQKSALLMAGLGTSNILHPAILKAFEIEPDKNSTFYDAEHIVILMQENRSFDHAFGAMKGVRGFKDKRAFVKADGQSIFFQKSPQGKYAIPTRLDIKNTKSTWMHDLPHSWNDQILARNDGKNDMWIKEKASGHQAYKDLPLTLGYYNREDLPFYYQLADAFTICDQYFCSSLTGTTPNRMFLWSGTIRKEKKGSVKPNVYNEHIGYERKNQVSWKTFPELLEEQNISWKIYQNEISLPKGLSYEQEAWLANFTDNPLEWVSQYNVKFSSGYYEYIPTLIQNLENQIKNNPKQKEKLESAISELKRDLVEFHPDNFKKLSPFHQNLHKKAFAINDGDPHFREIQKEKDEKGEEITIPKGDVLYQFRKDVAQNTLPTVSWLVAPQCFSDHPSAPWYGAWYISEIMNILTQNPEIWKKTIFIINYDENDGYFDHIMPFTPPNNPSQTPDMNGEDGVEFLSKKQLFMTTENLREKDKIEGPIGLGYRVPMIIASPWTRGGFVNSEVSDHTSVIQFLEHFIQKKF